MLYWVKMLNSQTATTASFHGVNAHAIPKTSSAYARTRYQAGFNYGAFFTA